MAAIQNLLDSNNVKFEVQEGESHNITGQFADTNDVNIALAALLSFTITLYNENDNAIINSRDSEDAKNVNSHTVATGGSFVVRLDPDDAVIVTQTPTTSEPCLQYHIAKLVWTWHDGTSVRTGIEQVRFGVQKYH